VIPKGKIIATRQKSHSSGSKTVEELLDEIHAPRTNVTNDGGHFVQRISSTPATKTDVVRLQETLDQHLLQKQARETGICPVREASYREAFGAYCVLFVPLPGPILFSAPSLYFPRTLVHEITFFGYTSSRGSQTSLFGKWQ